MIEAGQRARRMLDQGYVPKQALGIASALAVAGALAGLQKIIGDARKRAAHAHAYRDKGAVRRIWTKAAIRGTGETALDLASGGLTRRMSWLRALGTNLGATMGANAVLDVAMPDQERFSRPDHHRRFLAKRDLDYTRLGLQRLLDHENSRQGPAIPRVDTKVPRRTQ